MTLTRLDGDREKIKLKLSKQTTVAAIRARVEMEMGIPPHEQLLLFRGQKLLKDKFQPLSTPDLQEIIAEAGENGLQMAVAYQKRRLPGFLEKEGLEDVNMKRKTGATVLHRATRQCELSVIEELLAFEEFSGVNARDRSGQTALHIAASARVREACEILLRSDRFGLVGASDVEGRTALHLAAHWGDAIVCKMMLEHRQFKTQDAYAVDKLGYTALEYASECGHEEVAMAIKSKFPPGAYTPAPAPVEAAVDGDGLPGLEDSAALESTAGDTAE